MSSLLSHLSTQAFLPHQFEAALAPIFFFGLFAAEAFHESDRTGVLFIALLLPAFTVLAISPQGSFPHLISVVMRLIIGGWSSWLAFFDPPPPPLFAPPERWWKACCWITIDPLVWIVELAIFFRLDHPIFPVIWTVRRATVAGSLLILGLEAAEDGKYPKLTKWVLLIASIMIMQIILNLDEEDYYVTLGTTLMLAINHILGEGKAECNADEIFQNDFLIPFFMVNLIRLFKKK